MKTSSLLALSFSLLAPFTSHAQSDDPIIAQAEAYRAIYGSSLTSSASTKIAGVVNLKSVMPGFLYRGGSSTHTNTPLTETALKNLCEAGFSAAVYTYPTVGGFHQHTVNCSKGSLEYYGYSGENSTGRGKAMDLVASAIVNRKGPVLVHCWNGLHSSGNMSGSALMTFCGSSANEAKSYWKSNAGSAAAQAGSKFAGEAHSGVNLSPEQKAALCVH